MPYTHLKLINSYKKDSPFIIKEILSIKKGYGRIEWGAEKNKMYFINFNSFFMVKQFLKCLFKRNHFKHENHTLKHENHTLKHENHTLKHEYDSTRGLWCIDQDPKDVNIEWIRANAFQLLVNEVKS